MSRVEIRRTSGSLPISDFLSQLLCVRRNAFLSPPYIRAWMEGVEFTIRASGSVASHQSFLRVRFESSDSIGLAAMLFFFYFRFFYPPWTRQSQPGSVSWDIWAKSSQNERFMGIRHILSERLCTEIAETRETTLFLFGFHFMIMVYGPC